MRFTLVLPKHRLWRWHLDLIERLQAEGATVSVILDGSAPPYPRAVRIWARLERLWLGRRSLAEPMSPNVTWSALTTLELNPGDDLINLSERDLGPQRGWELRYDGALSSDTLIGLLLTRRHFTLEVSRVESGVVQARSRPALNDRSYLTRGLESGFTSAVTLILRAVRRPVDLAPQPTPRPAPRRTLAIFAARSILAKSVTAALRPLRRPDTWTTALRIAGGPFRPIDDGGARYFADPFLIAWNGKRFLFVEEYDHARGRGHLSAAEIVGDRLLAPPVPILECSYHLSYPHVFAAEGTWFMIPESGANRSVDLYRAVDGPWAWERVGCLLRGRVFADATPLFHDGLWWLFVAVDEHGSAAQDELHLYVSDRLTGPYEPHPMNPIQSDCRCARPAGRIRRQNGRLLRPAQICEPTYGAGIVWCVIEELTPTTYRETILTDWSGARDFGVRGIHSFDQLGDLQAIDLNGAHLRGLLRRPPPPLRPRSGSGFDTAFLADHASFGAPSEPANGSFGQSRDSSTISIS